MKVLDLNSREYTILHWITIFIENRIFPIAAGFAEEGVQYLKEHFSIHYHDYDVIIGYRADDSYFTFAKDFLNGAISVEQLGKVLYYEDLGEQIVLKSKKAFYQLEYVDFEPVDHTEWNEKSQRRDEKARKDYLKSERYKRNTGDLYIRDIIDGKIQENDARIQRIIFK